MKTVSISGSLRENVGKKDTKALRLDGQVPCVLYGGKEQIHFSVPVKQFRPLIYTPDVYAVDLKVGDKECKAILQETQYHVLSDELLHVDLLEVVDGKPVTMSIPVRTSGTSSGVRGGGRLVIKMKHLKTQGLLDAMPDAITVAIDDMEIGDSVRVEDIDAKGVTFLNSPKVSVVAVQTTRLAALEETVEAEAPAEGAEGAAPAEGAAAEGDAKAEKK